MKKTVKKRFIVETEMPKTFNGSFLKLALVGMMVSVNSVEEIFSLPKKKRKNNSGEKA